MPQGARQDIPALAAVPVLLWAVTLVACCIPARRTTKVDSLETLCSG